MASRDLKRPVERWINNTLLNVTENIQRSASDNCSSEVYKNTTVIYWKPSEANYSGTSNREVSSETIYRIFTPFIESVKDLQHTFCLNVKKWPSSTRPRKSPEPSFRDPQWRYSFTNILSNFFTSLEAPENFWNTFLDLKRCRFWEGL